MILALLIFDTVLVSVLAAMVGLMAFDLRRIFATQAEIIAILREAYPELLPPSLNGQRGRHARH
jgi:hypothetical protein